MEAVARFFSEWDGKRTYVAPDTVVATLRQRRLPPDARVLDIGFGNGEIALAVAQAWPAGQVDGIDLTQRNVTLATQRAQISGVRNASFRMGDITQWQPKPERYHAVIAMQVMQFIADADTLIERVFRALKPGGAFLFATPFLPEDQTLHPFFWDVYPRVIPHSFSYRTENDWYRALFDVGFRRIYVAKAHWDPLMQPPEWQASYRQTVTNHGLDMETARRHTWGGLISARKP